MSHASVVLASLPPLSLVKEFDIPAAILLRPQCLSVSFREKNAFGFAYDLSLSQAELGQRPCAVSLFFSVSLQYPCSFNRRPVLHFEAFNKRDCFSPFSSS